MNGPLPLGTGSAPVPSAPATSGTSGGVRPPGEGAFFALLQILGGVGKPTAPGLALLDAGDKPTLPSAAAREEDDALHQGETPLTGQAGYPAGLGWIVLGMTPLPTDPATAPEFPRVAGAEGNFPPPISWSGVPRGQPGAPEKHSRQGGLDDASIPADIPPPAPLPGVSDEQPAAAEKNLQEAALDEASIPVDADPQALPVTQGRPPAGDPDSGRGEAGQRALVSSEGGLSSLSSDRPAFPLPEGKASDPSLTTAAALARPSDPSSRIASDPAPVFSLPRALHHPEWAGDVGERVVWMRQADVKSAHLRLDPPHLGEIEVRITLHDEGAEVWFSTSSASVREALETALPRLRDLFTQHGLQLDQAGVSAEGSGGDSPAFTRPERPAALSRSVANLAQPSADLDLSRHGGLFEAYA